MPTLFKLHQPSSSALHQDHFAVRASEFLPSLIHLFQSRSRNAQETPNQFGGKHFNKSTSNGADWTNMVIHSNHDLALHRTKSIPSQGNSNLRPSVCLEGHPRKFWSLKQVENSWSPISVWEMELASYIFYMNLHVNFIALWLTIARDGLIQCCKNLIFLN